MNKKQWLSVAVISLIASYWLEWRASPFLDICYRTEEISTCLKGELLSALGSFFLVMLFISLVCSYFEKEEKKK